MPRTFTFHDRPTADMTAAVMSAITTRMSARAFLPTPVPRETLVTIFEAAARAPSGTNTQPWKVQVLTGAALTGLTGRLATAVADPAQAATHVAEYDYYPAEWRSPYIDRRRKVGRDLYELLGIARADKVRTNAQHARNYRFFDAPVGLIFTIDREMRQGSWLDYGMFLQNIMIAARAHGLHTCPQAAFARFHRIVRDHLSLPHDDLVICGMSLGHADPTAVVNSLATEREPLRAYCTFYE